MSKENCESEARKKIAASIGATPKRFISHQEEQMDT